MTGKEQLSDGFGKYLGMSIGGFTIVMILLSSYLVEQPFFNSNIFLQRLLVLSFGFGEIGIILAGTFYAVKHRIIVLKKETPQK